MAETATPHDAVFKTFLSRVETARDFIELHLPPSLTQICKLDTLRLESGSFLEDDLRPYYSDILYSLETTRGAGYVHVLIEHQSAPDKLMAFRLMRYAIAAMQRHLESGHKTLPLVIPILFYQGRRSPYPWSMRWLDNFADPETASQLYSGAFPLVDITVIPDDDIMQHRSMAALTLVQKYIRQRDMAQLLDKLTHLLMLEQMSGQQITVLVNYMAQAGDAEDTRTLLYGLAQRVPQHGGLLMTLAETWLAEGMEKGIREGVQQGIKEGKHQALVQVAEAMRNRGIDDQAIMEMTGLSEDELQRLRH
ncbi:TPA: Rpn family recombination-promoting nuclease/putative transposase [Klebsiella pneumoniae]|uniref:Rpn family recombination-promoting nuclease/putative transposase n=1 Tax=Klebsiella pneumoniae TaxID=573 RepID=UPI000D6FE801|nr:Rpn family recombination-promoting nuclease/putative transposase [Klebsiella pneumoniae]ELQ0673167.1 Rpn family recombination-promoting nuclease/putative transposase [Klebsiella pneumoniae]MEA4530134.1 Rpn family recombination-promoting nuclease/putative transposase [Klebsiella pneumoniae]PWS16106.1 ISNCY family transposase [Klebsiella pneumoniae]HCI6418998.1 Rpn family recombination-promoting nuclease/putative transposase [Klebsiella pneumoniae]HDY7275025.1 Rpn family recombination-promoti